MYALEFTIHAPFIPILGINNKDKIIVTNNPAADFMIKIFNLPIAEKKLP